MRFKYQAGFKKGETFMSCVASNSLYSILNIAEQQNYEVRQHLSDLRMGKLVIKNRYKILRRETNQLVFKVPTEIL